MAKLVIAEKPSVARDLARVLGASSRQNGFFQGKGWLITWCVGHLVELCEPHEYNSNWKRWSLHTLPMIPNAFRLRPVSRTKQQFQIVQRLLRRKDVKGVVNACDAGREGELIFRYVVALSDVDKPMERLWISSMTDEAIGEGFANLQPGQAFDRLWDAARCRSEADWLVGLNSTRAMTLRARQVAGPGKESPLLTVGRVQTPCLAMLVNREHKILNFVPQDYWQILGHFLAQAGPYQGRWFRMIEAPERDDKGRIQYKRYNRLDTIEEAQALMEKLQGAEGVVEKVEKKKAVERPPFLFDLTRLQRTANKRFGLSAARTLEIAQALYEKHKLLTYPRTDSTHLSRDMIPTMRPILEALTLDPYEPFSGQILNQSRIPVSKRVFNDAKVSDHHAIIPTKRRPALQRLSADEFRVYDLVVRRFLASFYPDAVFEKTTVITRIEEESFLTRGRVVVDRGWREVVGLPDHAGATKGKEGEDESHGVLPPLQEGDTLSVEELELQSKKTKPPPRYTEATLLAAMEGAGRMLEEEELQQAMRDSGLGTPATRASIIETLLRRNFVQRRGKSMVPTDTGMHLIGAIPVESLKSPELTGEWEARMSRIARGEASALEFQAQVCAYLEETIGAIKYARPEAMSGFQQSASSDAPDTKKKTTKKKTTKKKSTTSKKASSTKKKTTKTASSSKTTKKRASTSSKSRVEPKTPSDYVYTSPPPEPTEPSAPKVKEPRMVEAQPAAPDEHERAHLQNNLGFCPRCRKGLIIWGKRAWGCDQWRAGCRTTVPYTIAGYTLSTQDALVLLSGNEVGWISDLVDESGETYTGRLLMQMSSQHGFVQAMRKSSSD